MAVLTSSFPTSLDTPNTLGEVSNRAKSPITVALSVSGDTVITLEDATSFPSSGAVSIDSEIIYYNQKSSNELTIESRARQGTTASAHSIGAVAYLRFTKGHYEAVRSAAISTQTKLGVGSSTPSNATWLKGTGDGTSAWDALSKSDVGLNNVDNTSDLNKPVSNATATELAAIKYGRFTSVITPTIDSDKNNYNPGSNAHVIILTPDNAGPYTITGFNFGVTSVVGDRKILYNAGFSNIILSPVPSATNPDRRFYTNVGQEEFILVPNQEVEILYSEVTIGSNIYRWVILLRESRHNRGVENGYTPLNGNNAVPSLHLGQELRNNSIIHEKFSSYPEVSVNLEYDNSVITNKVDEKSGHYVIDGTNSYIFNGILSDEQPFEHGDTLFIRNGTESDLEVQKNNPLSGIGLLWSGTDDKAVFPPSGLMIARYNSNQNRFNITLVNNNPLIRFSPTITGSFTIDDGNWQDFCGKTVTVVPDGANTINIESVPTGFNCTFYQRGGSDTISFASNSYTLRNRQSHTAIAGEFGVVGVVVESNNAELILFGDTKA